MKRKDECIAKLQVNKAYLFDKYKISSLGIFGSVARDEHTESSDVDICFESLPMSAFTACRLKSDLERILGKSVDLLRMRKQLEGTYLKESIQKDMIYSSF